LDKHTAHGLPARSALRPAAPQRFFWHYAPADERPEVEGSKHLHWGITAFAEWAETGELRDSLTVEVEAPTEELAIARAQAIVVRPEYRVAWVRESCSLDPELRH
jgi:hypothetical protein